MPRLTIQLLRRRELRTRCGKIALVWDLGGLNNKFVQNRLGLPMVGLSCCTVNYRKASVIVVVFVTLVSVVVVVIILFTRNQIIGLSRSLRKRKKGLLSLPIVALLSGHIIESARNVFLGLDKYIQFSRVKMACLAVIPRTKSKMAGQ